MVRRGSIVALYNVTVESPDVDAPNKLDDLIISAIKDDILTNPTGSLATRNAFSDSVSIAG